MTLRFASVFLAFMVFAYAGCSQDESDGTWTQPKLDSIVTHTSFIYEEAPFPSAHASTIVETPAGMAAAWFGGTEEKDPDVGIWFSPQNSNRMDTPC